jgi:hypothetical protein
MVWHARVRFSCPSGTRTARFVGPSSGEALKKGAAFEPGPGCRKIGGIEMIKKGGKRKGKKAKR